MKSRSRGKTRVTSEVGVTYPPAMRTETIDEPSRKQSVALYLTPDEALVLDAFLARGQADGDNYATVTDQAELRVLWDLAAVLETRLPVVGPDYEEALATARARILDHSE